MLVLGAALGFGILGVGVWRTLAPPSTVPAAPSEVAAPEVPAPSPRDPDLPPNLLLVTLCSVRADHLGAWGYAGGSTPHLDTMAREGVVFERAWTAATFTLPSHATLLTGLLPRHAGVILPEDTLAATIPSLPEVLGLYGYHTVAWAPVASRASFRVGEGMERGFDTFLEGRDPTGDKGLLDAIVAAGEPWFALAHFKDAHPPYAIGVPGTELDPRVLEWSQRSSTAGATDADEWFLAQLMADPALRAHVAALYDHAITRTDAVVGSLLAGLERRGLLESTVVVVVGDHGQALGEDGQIGHQGILLPEVLHVPLLVRLPDAAEAGRRVSQDVGLVDLAPTLLTLAGAELPARLDGRSIVPLLHGKRLPERGVIVQADVRGGFPSGGPQEVLIRGDEWLRYATFSGAWSHRREEDGVWRDVPDAALPVALLAERERLSGPEAPRSERPLTDAERQALRREGYW
ncbi:MAG: sulfatase [Myxococcota bacterium]